MVSTRGERGALDGARGPRAASRAGSEPRVDHMERPGRRGVRGVSDIEDPTWFLTMKASLGDDFRQEVGEGETDS